LTADIPLPICSLFVLILSMNWYNPNAKNSPWIRGLAEVRFLASREGYRCAHVQAIIVAIDQYAEAALGNRDFFLNRPHGIGGKDDAFRDPGARTPSAAWSSWG
jgi:hypothetical protein